MGPMGPMMTRTWARIQRILVRERGTWQQLNRLVVRK
jgi:hypothetical protein